jgi:hypothetical protein
LISLQTRELLRRCTGLWSVVRVGRPADTARVKSPRGTALFVLLAMLPVWVGCTSHDNVAGGVSSPTATALTSRQVDISASSPPLGESTSQQSTVRPTSLPVTKPPALPLPRGGFEWGPPQRVTDHRVSDLDLPTGIIRLRGPAAWAFWVSPASRHGVQVEASSRGPKGRWSPAVVIGPPVPRTVIYENDPTVGRDGSPALARTLRHIRSDRETVMIALRRRGYWDVPRELGEGNVGRVVSDERGDVTIVWTAWSGEVKVLRVAQGAWQPPYVVAHNGTNPDLAVNRRGDLAVVWATSTGVGVSTRLRATGAWQPPTPMRTVRFPDDPRVVIDGRGRALTLWSRSHEEESYGRNHLSWASTRPDGSWTSPRYLDERPPRRVLGDAISLSMNSRGQALAGWYREAASGSSFRVARFRFGRGWTRPERVANAAYDPTALMTDAGVAIIAKPGLAPGWIQQLPRGRWNVGGKLIDGDLVDSFGEGEQMATMYRSGGQVMARFLRPNRS